MVGLTPTSPPASPPVDEDFDLPSPSKYSFDAHFGYTPSPSPPPEVANLLTQEQIDMGMYKVESGSGNPGPVVSGSMGPPQPVLREENIDTFKGRGATGVGGGRGARTFGIAPSSTSSAATRRNLQFVKGEHSKDIYYSIHIYVLLTFLCKRLLSCEFPNMVIQYLITMLLCIP